MINKIICAYPMGEYVHVSFDNNTFELMEREKFTKLKEKLKRLESERDALNLNKGKK